MRPISSIFEGCKVAVNARPAFPRGEPVVEAGSLIATAGRAPSLHHEVAAR